VQCGPQDGSCDSLISKFKIDMCFLYTVYPVFCLSFPSQSDGILKKLTGCRCKVLRAKVYASHCIETAVGIETRAVFASHLAFGLPVRRHAMLRIEMPQCGHGMAFYPTSLQILGGLGNVSHSCCSGVAQPCMCGQWMTLLVLWVISHGTCSIVFKSLS